LPIGSLFLTSQLITKLQKLSVIQSEIDKFLFFHSNPLELGDQHVSDLEQLIQKYPYSQTLKALLAKASENTSQFTFNLGIAAAFTSSRENLHHFIQHPEAFVTPITLNKDILDSEEILEEDFGQAFGVDLNEMMVTEKQPSINNDIEEFEVLRDDAFEEELVDSEIDELVPVVEETKKEEVFAVSDVEEQDLEEEIIEVEEPVSVVEETKEEEVFAVANVEEQDLEEEIIEVEEPVFVVEETKQEEVFAVADVEEQEVVEEIIEVEEPVSIVEEIEQEKVLAITDLEEQDVVEEIIEVEEPVSNVEETEQEEVLAIADVEEQLVAEQQIELPLEHIEVKNLDQELVFESPIQTDFFAVSNATQKTESVSSFGLIDKEHEVTPYHDDTMPYTFLWWLNKTRKEHDSNLRPFVANNPNKTRASNTAPIQDSLNSQIAENIFHLKGVEEIAVNAKNNVTVPFNFQNKESSIIEKFIKEEPQIKPPAANKIDTENKAKKSSEDANDVVSETLAKIYVEQMLYHKALDVYKKLSLKFPEKSAYFASQIKYLELKVN
jgi:hypothetical protein